jgi:LmbE family N-acetylglucosaminyl deacetylase
MMGTPENDAPESFWRADPEAATGRLVRLVREVRPQVIVSYNEFGSYGHPDHIRTAQVAKAAFERAADPRSFPEQLTDGVETWQPLKLYETAMDFSRREELMELMKERGIATSWLPADETDEQRAEREAWMERMRQATGPLTTRVDVREWLPAKDQALREHVTQLAADSWFLALSLDDRERFQPTEDFTLSVGRVGVRLPEDDLFAGLR